MPRSSELPPLAFSDVDVMCLAIWDRHTTDGDASPAAEPFNADPFTRALSQIGLELLDDGHQHWRLRCIGDGGEGIALDRRAWETLRHAVALDPRGVRAIVQREF